MSHGVLLDVKPKHQGNLLDFMCWITELDVKTVKGFFDEDSPASLIIYTGLSFNKN